MNSVTNRAFMAKKMMYKQPTTEVMDLKTSSLMDSITTSLGSGADPTQPPVVQAPGLQNTEGVFM